MWEDDLESSRFRFQGTLPAHRLPFLDKNLPDKASVPRAPRFSVSPPVTGEESGPLAAEDDTSACSCLCAGLSYSWGRHLACLPCSPLLWKGKGARLMSLNLGSGVGGRRGGFRALPRSIYEAGGRSRGTAAPNPIRWKVNLCLLEVGGREGGREMQPPRDFLLNEPLSKPRSSRPPVSPSEARGDSRQPVQGPVQPGQKRPPD